jgi:sugar transferase (PEP-CTERM/EpsH1 system associated)
LPDPRKFLRNTEVLPLESISGVSEAHLLREPDLKRDLSNLRVLQFAPRVPWPLDTGAKLRNYHLARVLSGRARIALLSFYEQAQNTMDLLEVYERIVKVPRDKAYSFRKILRGAIGRTPLPVLNYTSEQMKQTLARIVDENDFDIVQVESIHLMNYLPAVRAARSRPVVVCDWHNIESDLMSQYAAREPNLARKSYARRTARLMNQFEQRALGEFDAHIAVSDGDAERMRERNPAARIFVIENGVDTAYYADEQNQPKTKNRVLFVGSMDYHANIDAAVEFARDVWPAVHERKPELIFTIVGRDPTSAVRHLASIDGVEVTGSVEDVRPYYREAIAAVVPLKVGGGSRLKILEAMAAGVTVVSTTRGAEGLHVGDGENILLADSNEEFTEAIVKLIENPNLSGEISAHGRALAADRYDWSKIGRALFDSYQYLLSERAAPAGQR